LNESFGVFGEIIWLENKFGKDAADELNSNGMQAYLKNPDTKTKKLVRFNYKEKEEVFDGVTYQKGGCILVMLRDYIGDAAFYKGLNIYLTKNAFKSAEAHQLRLALEESSGMDLNWFFNQWYFGAGHPDLNINYQWDELKKTQTVYLNQTQDGNAYILPLSIDIYINGKKESHKSWMREKSDTLTFHLSSKPDLVNVDATKNLLSKKTDKKSLDEFVFQYFNAPLYLDRYEAIEAAKDHRNEEGGRRIILAALKDKYWGLRIKSINDLDLTNEDIVSAAKPILTGLADADENNLVRASAITALGKLKNPANLNLFKRLLKSESYAIQGAALKAMALISPDEALESGRLFENDNKGPLYDAIIYVYTTYGGNDQWPYIYKLYENLIPPKRFNIIQNFSGLAGRVEDHDFAIQGINAIKELAVKYKQFGIAPKIIELLNDIKNQRIKLGDTVSATDIDEAITQINDTK
jgi:aminopeptidase N